MPYFEFIWTDDNIEHVEEHGITTDDFEYVMQHPDGHGTSRTSGYPAVFGYTRDGRYVMAVYEKVDEVTIYPVTCFEVPEPR
jgi:hypothetical protein